MNKELKPQIDHKDLHIGCPHCSSAALNAPMDMVIAVGFGDAYVLRDGECVYSEQQAENEGEKYWTVRDAENMAASDPDHCWQIVKFGPLHGETFQRHSAENWVCIESNRGFA